MDYHGATLGERRRSIFLASKTADRTLDGSRRVLDQSLRRLRTDRLDLWQLHDLRTMSEVDAIFSKRGAIHALTEAREQGRVRFLGLTGHHDPDVLLEAMRRFDFDTLLVALNVADVHRRSFARLVLPEAARRGMGVIAMKVFGGGRLAGPDAPCSLDEAFGYALSLPGVSCAVIGCSSPAEVEANAALAGRFTPLADEQLRWLERKSLPRQADLTWYKRTG
jgi:predicted aldo/keto reductase-like oxidoreductase